MGRNVELQVLRGVQANLYLAMPLGMGEMYFSTDTGNLFFGTPGTGLGYIQIGDTTNVNERLDQLIVIMESMRRAIVAMALQDAANKEQDFDLTTISDELAAVSPIGR